MILHQQQIAIEGVAARPTTARLDVPRPETEQLIDGGFWRMGDLLNADKPKLFDALVDALADALVAAYQRAAEGAA